MERLTLPSIDYSSVGVVENMRIGTIAAMLCRLAAYEDTGISPEEVAAAMKDGTYAQFQEWNRAHYEGRLVVLDNQTALAIAAGERAIRTTKRLHGATYAYDIFGEDGGPYEIPYSTARTILEKIWDDYPLTSAEAEAAMKGTEYETTN